MDEKRNEKKKGPDDDLADLYEADRKRSEARRERLLAEKKRRERNVRLFKVCGIVIAALVVILLIVSTVKHAGQHSGEKTDSAVSVSVSGEIASGASDGSEASESETVSLSEDDQNVEVTSFSPHAVESTQPTNLMSYSEINVDGVTLEDKSLFEPWYNIDFGTPGSYTDVDGIVTFRGNPFRNDATYGTADTISHTFSEKWTYETGTLTYNDKTWSGNGWTGQPLMAKWPRSVKEHMNMYDDAKEDDDLVEVIYAGMDGNIRFLNLKTGEETRDPMYIGWTFKGAGALDPRGYPILYVGAGYNSDNGTARVFVVNLLDCSVMYTFGNNDEFSLRGSLSFFDSSALVDAESDTLIYPGENGILYMIHLNTSYNETAGTLSIDPDHVAKWHYWGQRSSDSSYWIGMEDSACVFKGYMFVADNGGNLMCIDLNTLTFVWVQDTLDDTNCSPVLSVENDHLYLYISTSFHLGWRSDSTATIPIWKIDAETGEIIWEKDYECYSQEGVSGGVQSTPALGKYGLSDYVYVTVSMTGSEYGGVCAAIRKDTGEVAWEHASAYAWSSPVCVYNSDGTGYVIYADAGGMMYFLDGVTGEELDAYSFADEPTIEASPAVYENYLVIGTRDLQICGFELE